MKKADLLRAWFNTNKKGPKAGGNTYTVVTLFWDGSRHYGPIFKDKAEAARLVKELTK